MVWPGHAAGSIPETVWAWVEQPHSDSSPLHSELRIIWIEFETKKMGIKYFRATVSFMKYGVHWRKKISQITADESC